MTPPPGPRRLSPPAPGPPPPLSFYSSPSSPPAACVGPGPPQSNLEDDSGFESLVTNVSDSGDHFLPPINGKLFCQVPFVPVSCPHRLTETLACPGWRSSSLISPPSPRTCSLLTLRLPPPLHRLWGKFWPYKAALWCSKALNKSHFQIKRHLQISGQIFHQGWGMRFT